jgi:hypothetical protein
MKHQNMIVYIDDLLVHTAMHEEHLVVLENIFEILHTSHLKINPEKCIFGNQKVSYLGFTLTPLGIKPERNKLQTIWDAQASTTQQLKW